MGSRMCWSQTAPPPMRRAAVQALRPPLPPAVFTLDLRLRRSAHRSPRSKQRRRRKKRWRTRRRQRRRKQRKKRRRKVEVRVRCVARSAALRRMQWRRLPAAAVAVAAMRQVMVATPHVPRNAHASIQPVRICGVLMRARALICSFFVFLLCADVSSASASDSSVSASAAAAADPTAFASASAAGAAAAASVSAAPAVAAPAPAVAVVVDPRTCAYELSIGLRAYRIDFAAMNQCDAHDHTK